MITKKTWSYIFYYSLPLFWTSVLRQYLGLATLFSVFVTHRCNHALFSRKF